MNCQKGPSEKVATIKKVWIFTIRQWVIKADWHCKKQGLDKVYEFDKKESDETTNKDDKKPTSKNINKSNLIHDANHGFYNYNAI